MTSLHLRDAVMTAAYAIAAAWCLRASSAARYLPRLPKLLESEWNAEPVRSTSVCVVVPALNEEQHLPATLRSLLCQDCAELTILAVDDRSTDASGAIMDSYAANSGGRLRAIHIDHLPEGWLGKTHAMHIAVSQSTSDYLLFTDADILFEPSIIRRALVYAERTGADHVVVAPTPDIQSAGEGAMLGFLQVLGIWASRPWRVADPKSKRDFLGVGAFNLVRRDTFLRLGGWKKQPMAVVEDVTLGRRLKLAGASQRFVVAPGAVTVHWAPGLAGIIRVMTKNLFAVMFFQPILVLTSSMFVVLFFLAPLGMLLLPRTATPGIVSLICIAICYSAMRPITSISVRHFWLYPLGALAFLWAMFLSMFTVLRDGGVEWRGTHYALAALRAHNRFSVRG